MARSRRIGLILPYYNDGAHGTLTRAGRPRRTRGRPVPAERRRGAAHTEALSVRMILLGVAVRWLQLATGLCLIGVFPVRLLAGRSDCPTVRLWEARLARWTPGLVAAALLSGLAALAYQSAVATGRPAPPALPAAVVDVLHLVTAGAWLGSLLPLALLLRRAASEAGADARPYAVLAVRRFSRVALAAMLLIIASGLLNA